MNYINGIVIFLLDSWDVIVAFFMGIFVSFYSLVWEILKIINVYENIVNKLSSLREYFQKICNKKAGVIYNILHYLNTCKVGSFSSYFYCGSNITFWEEFVKERQCEQPLHENNTSKSKTLFCPHASKKKNIFSVLCFLSVSVSTLKNNTSFSTRKSIALVIAYDMDTNSLSHVNNNLNGNYYLIEIGKNIDLLSFLVIFYKYLIKGYNLEMVYQETCIERNKSALTMENIELKKIEAGKVKTINHQKNVFLAVVPNKYYQAERESGSKTILQNIRETIKGILNDESIPYHDSQSIKMEDIKTVIQESCCFISILDMGIILDERYKKEYNYALHSGIKIIQLSKLSDTLNNRQNLFKVLKNGGVDISQQDLERIILNNYEKDLQAQIQSICREISDL